MNRTRRSDELSFTTTEPGPAPAGCHVSATRADVPTCPRPRGVASAPTTTPENRPSSTAVRKLASTSCISTGTTGSVALTAG